MASTGFTGVGPRSDGYVYPTGAKISPNGMYYDTGKGWQFALPGTSVSGAAPGTPIPGLDHIPLASTTSAASTTAASTTPATTGTTGTANTSTPATATPTAAEVQAELRKQQIAAQVADYLAKQKSLTGF